MVEPMASPASPDDPLKLIGFHPDDLIHPRYLGSLLFHSNSGVKFSSQLILSLDRSATFLILILVTFHIPKVSDTPDLAPSPYKRNQWIITADVIGRISDSCYCIAFDILLYTTSLYVPINCRERNQQHISATLQLRLSNGQPLRSGSK